MSHTGDIGHFHEDGYLVLVDRTKDTIGRGGENTYPREIEAVTDELPQIAEDAVVGRAHPVYAEVPVLSVSTYPGATLRTDAIDAYLARPGVEIHTTGADYGDRYASQERRRQD